MPVHQLENWLVEIKVLTCSVELLDRQGYSSGPAGRMGLPQEIAAALEPFGGPRPPEQTPGHSGMSLSLAKALVEANRARFQIKSAPHSGTLIEITFAQVTARA